MMRFRALSYAAISLTILSSETAKAAEPADWLITAKYVVTMDSQHRVLNAGAVAIRGDHIVAVGPADALRLRFNPSHILNRSDSLIIPGFIDTHTHAPMSLLRAIADDHRLDDWLTNYIFPAESKNVAPEFVRWGTRLACLEMVLAGITTYTDMYFFEDVEAETAREAGVRGVLGQTVIGFPAPDHKTWQETLAAAEQYIKRFRDDALITPAVAPHAIYTTPDEALIAAHNLARKYNVPLTIHLAETRRERDESLEKRGQSPTQVLEKLGLLDGTVIAAHGVWESDEDLQILKRRGVGVAHCPSSNTKLASGVARVVDMLNMGIHVGLGTDGFAGSNDTADLLLEMDIASKLQKVTKMDPTVLPAEQTLEMATIGGARVLGLDKKIGSLEEGKLADLVTVSLAGPNAVPLYNVYSQLAYATKTGDVQDVFINGRQIVSERRPLTLNPDEIFAHAKRFREQILESLKK